MVVIVKDRRWQELEKSRTPLDKLVRHFETYNRSEAKSARTVEWYTRVLRFYQRYLEEQGHSKELGALTLDIVREFVLYLQTRRKWDGHPYIPSPGGNLAAISVNNYIRGLRAFFSWLHRDGYTEEHILARLKPPKIPQKLVEVLTDADVGSILACLDPNMASGCRDITMVITLLDTGLRLSELAGLKMADAHVDQCYLKVMGKGARERMVPIGSTCRATHLGCYIVCPVTDYCTT